MVRGSGKPLGNRPLVDHGSLEERWNAAAAQLLESLTSRTPATLDPELERFLGRLIRARARDWHRSLDMRALGVDSEDVVQKVFLQLLEHPPDRELTGPPLRRLISWVNTVSHNYLHALTARRTENLRVREQGCGEQSFRDRESGIDARTTESRYAARQTLLRLQPLVAAHYPAGLPLLDLLLDSPQATSNELAQRLSTSTTNIDQMRCRLRRVLREHLKEPSGEHPEVARRKR